MMSVLVASGLMVGLGVAVYWLLAGEPAPETRWNWAPRHPYREPLRPEVAAQNLLVTRVFGAIGELEIRGAQRPAPRPQVYRAPPAPRVPLVAIERAAAGLRSSTTLAPKEAPREDYTLPAMVWS